MVQATVKLGALVKDYVTYNAWAKNVGGMAKQSTIEKLYKAA